MSTNQQPVMPLTNRLPSFNFDRFSFGETPTDHMFLAQYREGEWGNARLVAFENFSLSPFSLCFHYGQTVFEGMKAFRLKDGTLSVFRLDSHHARLNRSLERMCMPPLPYELFMEGLSKLIRKDAGWLPQDRPTLALYIRPFVIASQPRLGVAVSTEYLFCIVCTPIDRYYDKPLRVKVETEFVRVSEGGAGYAKCGGNYGGAFYPTLKAGEQGFDQVIWTDAATHQYLEEAGTMNIMVGMDGVLVTPPLGGTILEGITRDSLIQLARDWGIQVEERKISIQELRDCFRNGVQTELFGVGTAAVVSPIACVRIDGTDYHPYCEPDAMMFRLKNGLEAIRRGVVVDDYHWNYPILGYP